MNKTLFLLPLLFACGEEANDEPAVSAPPAGVVAGRPESFQALEAMWLDADSLQLDFEIRASGAAGAEFAGKLTVARGNYLHLIAEGGFMGTPMKLGLTSDGTMLQIRTNDEVAQQPTPPELHKAVVIGLTRMGLLHNLAVLSDGAPPDHAAGGVAEWVQVEDGGAEPLHGDAAFTFRLFVAGQEAGTASLLLSGSGAPSLRLQSVAFPSGTMDVREAYSSVVVNGTIEPGLFVIE